MAAEVGIGILGPLEVTVGPGEAVDIPGQRLPALLARLAIDPGRVVASAQLAEAVWEDDPPAGAANALQSLVTRLRRLLPGLIDSSPAGYRLAVEPETVDASRFETRARAGRAELAAGRPGDAAATLRAALALWRGPALAGVTAGFAAAPAARLEELRLATIEDRVDADLATDGAASVTDLVAELDELATAHPHRERLCGLRMLALARAGRPADALDAYERLRAELADQLGIDPGPALQAVHVRILRGEGAAPAAAPAAPAAEALPARTNLRAQITSFVGRDGDLARIMAALDAHRLVTLTGPGGAGKTRLAGEAAVRLLGHMPGGVWLVELAPVLDPVDLAQAVLSLFGARELALVARRGAAAVAPVERLADAIGERRLLLVLDNCEHLVADVAAMVDRLLAECPQLRVLATSRERLGLTGELLHPVGPLGLPQGADALDPESALAWPAVRLLADRAAAVRPGFAVDAGNLEAVLRICRALDGMPLAIELAAARLRAMAPDEVAARLDDRFRLLAGGTRPALARHQTLRAVVDWSWELLTEPERVLARRLAVFAGGATIAAAEAVCARPELGGPDQGELLDLLTALVDKSLVVAEPGRSGGTRYRMLETVRAYGLERLAEAGEDAAVRAAHAAHFLALAEAADPHLRRAEQLDWLARLNAERDNLHAALRWSVDAGRADLAYALVAALGWWWFLRSARAEGSEWAAQALAVTGGTAPGSGGDRARVFVTLAMLTIGPGTELARAAELVDQAAALAATLDPGDPALEHPLLTLIPATLAILRGREGDPAELAKPATGPDPWAVAVSDMMHGLVLANMGEAGLGESCIERALAGFRAIGERWGAGQAMLSLAELASYRARHDVAIAMLEEAGEVFAGLGNAEDLAFLRLRLAQQRVLTGQAERAEAELRQAERVLAGEGTDEQRLLVRFGAAELARHRGELAQARAIIDEAAASFGQVGGFPDQMHAVMLAARGQLDLDLGDRGAARDAYGRALAIAVATRDGPVVAKVVELGAAIAMAGGDAELAAGLLGQAESLRGLADQADPDVRRVRAAAGAALGEQGFALALERGAGRRRAELMAELGASAPALVRPGAGTPAGPAGRTPPRSPGPRSGRR